MVRTVKIILILLIAFSLKLNVEAQEKFSLEWALKNSGVSAKKDSTLHQKMMMAGTKVTVPDTEIWVIEKVLCQVGSFSMEAASMDIPDTLAPGESIVFPIFSTESQLLDDGKSDPSYILKYRVLPFRSEED